MDNGLAKNPTNLKGQRDYLEYSSAYSLQRNNKGLRQNRINDLVERIRKDKNTKDENAGIGLENTKNA